ESYGKLYVSNSDPSVENDYILASLAYVKKDYQNAISTANKIIQQSNNNAKPRVYRLLAYSYLDTKDTAKACEFSNQFLAKAGQEDLLANDFILHANTCGANDPAVVNADIDRALSLDTVLSSQIALINKFVTTARTNKQYGLEGRLMLKSHELRAGQANPADLFYIGTRFYYGNDFPTADTVFSSYVAAFPDTVNGYYWRALSRAQMDSGMKAGLAVPDLEKTITLAEPSKERFKDQAAQAAQMLALYYNNVKKDRPAAQAIVAKGLEFDPANATLQTLSKQLGGGANKPAASTGKAGDSKTSAASSTETSKTKR
ncbi:MAG TPA: hypothetical protein VMR70_10770, partial [Flavisolibacter sp.]|nr:hypothetical protein [Flavisolibacter sp.]